MMWQRKDKRDQEIAPDEIFLDSSNAPDFDRARFEGRIEKPLSKETFFSLFVFLAIIFAVLIIRAWNLEIINGAAFEAQSTHNSLKETTLFALRGNITDKNGIVLAENIKKDDGTVIRNYTIPSLSHVIGYVSYPKKDASGVYYDTNITGITGIEAGYDSVLSGENGKLLTEIDALGNIRSEGTIVPAKEGKPIQITVDANLQELFSRAIAEIAKNKHFIAGAGVVLDVHTGAVRAIVSYPSYDSNVMSSGGPSNVIALYNTDPGHPFIDHAIQGVYVPGSIVKPFIALGALTDGIITKNTIINDQGLISIPDPYNPGKTFNYTGWKILGPVDVKKAIAWSSDIFFYTVGGGFGNQKGLGINRLEYWYRQFGLGSPTGIDLAGEASGLIPTPEWKQSTFNEPWYLGDTYFTAIGQYSMQVTPIQMARATAAIANGGKLFKPRLVDELTPPLTLKQTQTFIKIPISESSIDIVREGMRQSVTSALAGALNLPYVKVAAKTGTAQTGMYNQYDNSWVEGFFPYDDPQYAFVVVLERGPSGTGSQAVNVMRDLFDSLYAENSQYVGGS